MGRGQEDAEEEGAQVEGSGPGPTSPKVQGGATATPSPMAMGIVKAETRGEAAETRGKAPSQSPKTEKIQTETKVEGEAGGKWREDQALLRPQIPVWWCECPLHTQPLHPKAHSSPLPDPKSILPGLCKMRRKTSGVRATSQRGAGAGSPTVRPPPRPWGPTLNGYFWLGSRDPPKFRRKAWSETLYQAKSLKRPED